MQIEANVDIEFEIDEDEFDIETWVVTVLEQQLDSYISDIPDNALCSLGEKLKQAIRLTVRDMTSD